MAIALSEKPHAVVVGRGPVGALAAFGIAKTRPDVHVTLVGPENIGALPSSLIMPANVHRTYVPETTAAPVNSTSLDNRFSLTRRALRTMVRSVGVVAPHYRRVVESLEGKLRELPNVTIVQGKVIQIQRDEGKHIVTIENREERHFLTADLLVGATGKAATVARELRDIVQERAFIQHGATLAAYVRLPQGINTYGEDITALSIKRLPSNTTLMFLPAVNGGHLVIIGGRNTIIKAALGDFRAIPPNQARMAAIKKLVENTSWANILAGADVEDTVYHATSKVHTRKVQGNVVLVGDEASSINQRFGIGLVRGARDVRRLVATLRTYEDIQQAGRAYNRRRNRTAFLEAHALNSAFNVSSKIASLRRSVIKPFLR